MSESELNTLDFDNADALPTAVVELGRAGIGVARQPRRRLDVTTVPWCSVMPVARKEWLQIDAGSPTARQRRLTMPSTAERSRGLPESDFARPGTD